MTAAEFAERLGARRSGRGWIACCPAHDDRWPSLSIAEGRDGRILVYCFAGCPVERILEAAGLRMGDLFAESRPSRAPVPPEVRAAEKRAAALRCRLTPRERVLPVTVVLATVESLNAAIARALALAVEGEVVQVAFKGDQS